jgi:alkanesulfonate monooxygenase SsuD/methylene tetrahydromethanopterin reductase-like flavin-dependent oxidoreductase (luciferase family)
VRSRLAIAIIGGAETCKTKLTALLERTGADEFIFVSDFYDFKDRLRSFEILAGIKDQKSILKNAELAV